MKERLRRGLATGMAISMVVGIVFGTVNSRNVFAAEADAEAETEDVETTDVESDMADVESDVVEVEEEWTEQESDTQDSEKESGEEVEASGTETTDEMTDEMADETTEVSAEDESISTEEDGMDDAESIDEIIEEDQSEGIEEQVLVESESIAEDEEEALSEVDAVEEEEETEEADELYAATLVWPVPGHTSLSQGFHDGCAIDISDGGINGATVVAALGGTVTNKFTCSSQHYGSMHTCYGFGTGIVIKGDDGRFYQYAHMQGGSIPSNIDRGSRVEQGQTIGRVGKTGYASGVHLHFGISYGSFYSKNGVDPSKENYGTFVTDVTKPQITNVVVSDITADSYTVSCNVSDNVGVERVEFPTWTVKNGQDDLIWHEGTISGNKATFTVKRSEHNNEYGEYVTHIYAFDAAGNQDHKNHTDYPALYVNFGKEMESGFDRTIPDGDYMIANAGTTDKTTFYYLDIYGSEQPAAHATNVTLCGATNGDIPAFDVWTLKYDDGFYSIKQKDTNMALDVYNYGTHSGANVIVASNHGKSNQRWAISEKGNGYRIQSKISGLSLDVAGGGTISGTNVQQYTNNDTDAQSWLFIPYKPSQPVENGRYVLLSGLDNSFELAADGNNGNVAENANLQIWEDTVSSKYNSFDVKKRSNGYYDIIHHASGKSVDIYGGVSVNSSNVSLHSTNESIAQQFAIMKNGKGYSVIGRCSGYALDVARAIAENGRNVQQYPFHGGENQTWMFVPAEYTVTYDANGGSGAPAAQIKYYKESLALSNTKPVRDGYTFLGWSEDSASKTASYKPASTYTKDEDMTLYAVWEKIEEVQTNTSVTGVKLNKNTLSLQRGEKVTLVATVSPYDASNKNVTWTSNNEDIATVSPYGRVEAIGAGDAVISVMTQDGGFRAQCNVTVEEEEENGEEGNGEEGNEEEIHVTGVSLNKTSLHLMEGEWDILDATVIPSNATNKDVTWESDDEDVATVSEDGFVEAVEEGTTVIRVITDDGYEIAECSVTVTKKSFKVSKVALNKKTASIQIGKTVSLSATISPSYATNKAVSWKSSKASVASVSSKGIVKGNKVGTATITVTTKDGGKKATCTVTVKPISVNSVKLNKKTATIKKGNKLTLKATVAPSNATDKSVTWKSSNRKIATVTSKGVVKGIKKGMATITVTTKDGRKTATCKVTVK